MKKVFGILLSFLLVGCFVDDDNPHSSAWKGAAAGAGVGAIYSMGAESGTDNMIKNMLTTTVIGGLIGATKDSSRNSRKNRDLEMENAMLNSTIDGLRNELMMSRNRYIERPQVVDGRPALVRIENLYNGQARVEVIDRNNRRPLRPERVVNINAMPPMPQPQYNAYPQYPAQQYMPPYNPYTSVSIY